MGYPNGWESRLENASTLPQGRVILRGVDVHQLRLMPDL